MSTSNGGEKRTVDELERRHKTLVDEAIANGNSMAGLHALAQSFGGLAEDAIAALREAERREAVLRNRAEEAEDELEAWRKWDNGDACNADLMAERDALALRVEALTRYTIEHKAWCAHFPQNGIPCDCGLSALLAPPTTTTEREPGGFVPGLRGCSKCGGLAACWCGQPRTAPAPSSGERERLREAALAVKPRMGPAKGIFYGGNTNEHLNPEVVLLLASDFELMRSALATPTPSTDAREVLRRELGQPAWRRNDLAKESYTDDLHLGHYFNSPFAAYAQGWLAAERHLAAALNGGTADAES